MEIETAPDKLVIAYTTSTNATSATTTGTVDKSEPVR